MRKKNKSFKKTKEVMVMLSVATVISLPQAAHANS